MSKARKLTILSMALGLLTVSLPALARDVPDVCYSCDNSAGYWNCASGGGSGGTNCCVSSGSCTVSGDCGGSTSSVPGKVSAAAVLEVAEVHPRIGATLWTLSSDQVIEADGRVFWHNSAISPADVTAMVLKSTADLKGTPGDMIVHRYYLDVDPATGGLSLVITPETASDLDGPFSAFILQLEPAEDGEGYVAGSWSLF